MESNPRTNKNATLSSRLSAKSSRSITDIGIISVSDTEINPNPNSNPISSLSVSVNPLKKKSSIETEPCNKFQSETSFSASNTVPEREKENIGHNEALNHNEIIKELDQIRDKRKKSLKYLLIPGFGIGFLVLMAGIILGLVGAFGGN